jgi:hypothetical protein
MTGEMLPDIGAAVPVGREAMAVHNQRVGTRIIVRRVPDGDFQAPVRETFKAAVGFAGPGGIREYIIVAVHNVRTRL